jgi:cation diffusion facilitator CzcD-associated flavoprotein CzcO
MPKGMRLRSAWHASHISDPDGRLSLDAYAQARGLPRRENVPLEDFVAYGEWFQGQTAPDLDRRRVQQIEPAERGFRLALEDGKAVHAARVVLATGLHNQDFRPAPFAGLPAALISHTSDHDDLGAFRGRRVAVIGRGQSACESAALLSEAGAEVDLICRSPVHWVGSQRCAAPVGSEPLLHPNTLLIAPSGVGPFPLNWLNEAPGIVHRLPARLRGALVARSTRAGAAAWVLPRVAGVRIDPGRTVLAARADGERITLQLDTGARSFDHVLLATGYKVALERLNLFAPQLLERIRCGDGAPVLAAGFESSVPGLHFVGAVAIASFGALNRFVAGCGYAARAVTRTVVAGRRRQRRQPHAQPGEGVFASPKAAPH